ncbi:MAG: SulP family inorganic anion transporter [Pirellulaceae bacterium]
MADRVEPEPSSESAPVGNAEGFHRFLKEDLISGLQVFLIALPLCLGIASASEFPVMAGVLTAIGGALVAPWISNSELTIKGPAAGLIVITLGAIQDMSHQLGGREEGYRAVLAIGVAAGAVQILFGMLKLGGVSDFFPSSVVHGMMAAIGVIILSKQTHVLLGVVPEGKEPLELLWQIPHSVCHANLYLAFIGLACLFLLIALPLSNRSIWKKIPVQMVVMVLAILMGLALRLGDHRIDRVAGLNVPVTEKALVQVPQDILGAMTLPDFHALQVPSAWFWIAMYALIGSLESVLSARAIDMLDPYGRRSSMNRDLLAVGVGNAATSMIGGMPMISEIVRSKANIDNGAKTRFANFWHGIFLLLSIVSLGSWIQLIPTPALAAMLVYTGMRLANPNEFVKMYRSGVDQLLVFVFTMGMVLSTDLLIGILLGVLMTTLMQLVRGVPLRSLFQRFVEVTTLPDGSCLIQAGQSAVFSNWSPVQRRIRDLGLVQKCPVVVDLSRARYVDQTVQDRLKELREEFARENLSLVIRGLDANLAVAPRDSVNRSCNEP